MHDCRCSLNKTVLVLYGNSANSLLVLPKVEATPTTLYEVQPKTLPGSQQEKVMAGQRYYNKPTG